ncbi:MAG: hypothetical protein HYY03_03430 [Chloroflexi bacterium]|nr:hypothetical protein [Chloroflexota bacterium]
MSPRERGLPDIDETLLAQVAALPHGGQRWLRTALHAISTIEPETEVAEKKPRRAPRREAKPPQPERPAPGRAGSLDQVLSGEASLEEQVEAYPELAEELKGVADIADLLRELGRERRRLGEDILRENESEPGDEGGNGQGG